MTTAGNVGWDDEIILRKQAELAKVSRSEADLNAARRAGAPISTERKVVSNAPAGEDFRRIAKVAESPEIIAPKTVTADVGKIMAKARIEKKITQKELSAVVHEKPSVVRCLALLLLLLLFAFPSSLYAARWVCVVSTFWRISVRSAVSVVMRAFSFVLRDFSAAHYRYHKR